MEKKYRICGCELNEKNITLQETIFHNANGYIGVRGTLEEECPDEFDTMRGMYINGFYDMAPMKQAEKLCNLVEDKETMVNVADTQTIKVSFNGREFSMFDGTVSDFERVLDMEQGVTDRNLTWKTTEGCSIEFAIRRMTSFENRSLFTIDYTFHSVDFEGEAEFASFQKGLVKNYCNPDDPRLADESPMHLISAGECSDEIKSCLAVETVESKLTAVTAVAHQIFINGEEYKHTERVYSPEKHQACVNGRFEIHPGDEVRIVKYTVVCDSVRCEDCMKKAGKVLDEVLERGIGYYYEKQKEFLKKYWENAELEIDGDDDLNASVSFNMYQLLQSAGTDGYSSIAAKGLSGEGYEGHYFWDTEMYMLPYFTLTDPEIAKGLLNYRYTILQKARENAALLGHERGALYPWRTITGRECSGYYPSGTAQYHINGDIAYAVILYYHTTGDWEFMKEQGMEMLLETARLWLDVGNFYNGKFHINCVTGPDEYTCVVNNNYYTNASAKYNLEQFISLTEKLRKEADVWERFRRELKVTDEELSEMKQAAEVMNLPYDEKLGINPQDDSFLQKPVWDLVHTEKEKFPLLMHYHPLHLYRYQVCKQADTVLAYFLFPEYQSEEAMRNSFLYYETITTHDSSLSTCVFSIEASRLGMTDKAYAYFGDSAKLDLLNTHNNTKDGIHAANMGGCYMAVINGFAGLRISGEGIEIAPALPEQWNGYHFRFRYHDSSVRICVDKEKIAVELTQGGPVSMKVYGRSMQLLPGQPISEKLRR